MANGHRQVVFNEAQNVSESDLNNSQNFLRAFVTDWCIGQAGSFVGVGDVGASMVDRNKSLYVLGDSAAPFPVVGSPHLVNNLSGFISQWKFPINFPLATQLQALTWGQDPFLLVRWVDIGDLAVTHAAPDVTNPRWDLVSIQLDLTDNSESRLQKQEVSGDFVISSDTFVTSTQVTLTKTVTVGTPAASPTMPALPAGHVPFYAVKIPAGGAPADLSNGNDFHDYRMPLGAFHVDVHAMDMVPAAGGFGATYQAITGPLGAVKFLAAANLDFIPRIPISPNSCRLLGVSSLSGGNTNGFTVSVGSYLPTSGGSYSALGGNSTWTLANLGTGATNPGADSDYRVYQQELAGIAGNDPPSAAAKPPWGGGMPSGYANRRELTIGTSNLARCLGVRYATAGANPIVQSVRFHFAGMPY